MRLIIFLFALSLLLVTCDKGGLPTTPSLELKSISTRVVPLNGDMVVQIKVKDKEGDISDTFYIRKYRLNKRPVSVTLRDSIPIKIPEVPAKTWKSEFEITFKYQDHLISAQSPLNIPGTSPPQKEPDTLLIKVWMKDKAKHVSDTLSLGQVIVIR